MQKFLYKAKNKQGKLITGEIETVNQASAAKILLAKKLYPIEIADASKQDFSHLERLPFLTFLDRVSKKKKAVAVRQLATLINAGLPITQSLQSMASESANKQLSTVFTDILQDVEGGSSLSEAFAKHPKVFSSIDVSLVTAGEKSGTLDQVLKRMAIQLEKEAQLISKIRGAMIYPTVIITAVVGVILIMLVYVLPKMASLYQDFNAELPATTRFLMVVSSFLQKFWWLSLLLLIAAILGFRQYKKTPSGQKIWDMVKLRLPAIKSLIIKIYLARFTRTLGTLVASGVPVLDSLKITSDSVGNVVYREEILKMTEKIRGGTSLSQAIIDSGLFPSVAGQMIKVGEQTGEIDSMLDSMANYYEEEVDNIIKSLSTLIEPLIIIVLGVTVGFILISVMSPIYQISQAIFKR